MRARLRIKACFLNHADPTNLGCYRGTGITGSRVLATDIAVSAVAVRSMPQYNPVDMTFSNSIKFLIGESSSASPEGSAESARPAIEQSSSQSRSKPQPSRNTSRTNASDGRPRPPQRIPSVQTRYMDMLLSQDTIPRLHNILASFFQWILLAGYLVLPATFNSISESNEVQTSSQGGNIAAKAALTVVKNVPLLYVGAFGAGVGLTGKACLYFVHRRNYIWLVNKIFMCGFCYRV